MSNENTFPSKRVAVRGPFRVLAALICGVGLVGMSGMAYALWHDSRLVATDPQFVKALLGLPGMLFLVRLTAHCALHGTTPEGEHSLVAIRVGASADRIHRSHGFRGLVRR
jgi:hypothetical protein